MTQARRQEPEPTGPEPMCTAGDDRHLPGLASAEQKRVAFSNVVFSDAGRPQEVGGSWYLKRNPPTGAPCRPFPTDTGWVGGKTKPEQPHAGLPAPQQHGAAAPQKPAWPSARLQGSGSCEATVMTASTPTARQSRRKHSPASTTRTSEASGTSTIIVSIAPIQRAVPQPVTTN